MIAWIRLSVLATAVLLCSCAAFAQVPDHFVLEIRTLTSLNSRSASGPVEAELVRPLLRGDEVWMPRHSRLFGTVRAVHSVGLGLRRERASIELHFDSWQEPNGEKHLLDATPLVIDNAREQVDNRGRIQGILAASNPLGISRGFWFRPSARLLRTPAGFGGSTGTTWLKAASGPLGSAGLLGARLLLTRLPDPEIDLPAGTEMTIQVHCAELPAPIKLQPRALEVPAVLSEFLERQPTAIFKPNKTLVADIINVALMGSEESVRAAFEAAGWSTTNDLDRQSFKKAYKAFTQRHGYPEAPVSKLYYEGRLPDLVFQKSLNSIAKRHHVRLWQITGPSGEELWLGAATHDITVSFNKSSFGLQHKINRNVDPERDKVTNDLEFADAVEGSALISRSFLMPAGTISNRALALVALQAPGELAKLEEPRPAPKFSRLHRLTRRVVLEGRHYLLRDNPYYLVFATARKLVVRSSNPILAAAALSNDPLE